MGFVVASRILLMWSWNNDGYKIEPYGMPTLIVKVVEGSIQYHVNIAYSIQWWSPTMKLLTINVRNKL